MSQTNQYSISPIAAAVSAALATPVAALAQDEQATTTPQDPNRSGFTLLLTMGVGLQSNEFVDESTAGLAGHPWTAAYSASKGGVHALTAGLAVEYGKQGVRANAVCPGSIKTPITKAFHVPEGADPKLIYRIMPLDEHRPPEVVASTVAFIASDEAVHINGETIRVDGATLS